MLGSIKSKIGAALERRKKEGEKTKERKRENDFLMREERDKKFPFVATVDCQKW